MKLIQEIRWMKAYNEELGTKDENGLYDYAYCYYIYRFYLPDKSEMKARRYTDTPEKCALFIPNAGIGLLDTGICAISKFLLEAEGVREIEYFTPERGYEPVDVAGLKCQLSDFAFQQISV